jgi:predicted HTH transcriptional regulator
MNAADLSALLDRLRAEPRESEWLEFKANRYDAQAIGEYLSALANSACLLGKPRGYLVFGSVAAATGDKAQHIRNRGLDNRYYRDLIVDLVREHQPVSREDIDKLLLDKLPEVLSTEQKTAKIHNLLTSLSGKRIQNVGTRQASRWVLLSAQQQ